MKNSDSFNVLHVCTYSAPYRGNFIDSLESLEQYHPNIKNFYLFPVKAQFTPAQGWINELNREQEIAYIQKNNLIANTLLFLRIIKKHRINRIVRHFSDKKIDLIIKLLFNSKNVIRLFHCVPETENSALKHKLKQIIWKRNKLVGVSDNVARDIEAVFPGFDVYSLVNAVHFDRLNNIDEFIKAEGISLLMMGWDYRTKGVDLAIKAVDALRGKYDLTLQIVSGESEAAVRALARDILGEDVDWIRYLPSTNNVGTYFNSNDIFLSPSRHEAFGYANVEAAYCKNCIVLSRVDGQGELQIDGAYWFEPDNLEDFIQKLEQAVTELDLPEKIAQRERTKAQVEQTYSLQEWSNKFADIF